VELLVGVIGVLIGGLVTAMVQWAVTPRVERRIRAEQRNEEHMLELTTLVRQDIPAAAQRARNASWSLATANHRIASGEWDEASTSVKELRRRLVEELVLAGREWDAVIGWRIDWLFDRVGERYGVTHRRFLLDSMKAPSREWQLDGMSPDDVDAAWDAERKAREALVKLVDGLVEQRIPGLPGKPEGKKGRKVWLAHRSKDRSAAG